MFIWIMILLRNFSHQSIFGNTLKTSFFFLHLNKDTNHSRFWSSLSLYEPLNKKTTKYTHEYTYNHVYVREARTAYDLPGT